MNANTHTDHYLVYDIRPVVKKKRVRLQDQFDKARNIWTTHDLEGITKFANPATKNKEKPSNNRLHYTWWDIQGEFSTSVHIQHQLIPKREEHEWTLNRLSYLVMPALKNADKKEELPKANHYKAYSADGPKLNKPLSIKDQWNKNDWRDTLPLLPVYFLTPTAKRVVGKEKESRGAGTEAEADIIADSRLHLACYQIPRFLRGIGGVLRDQFASDIFVAASHPDIFCIPCSKRWPQE